MSRYAAGTSVSIDRTQNELKDCFRRYGASEFAFHEKTHPEPGATVAFKVSGRLVQMALILPDPKDKAITHTRHGYVRSPTEQQKEWEAACRQRWRCLLLVVKAKLEAIESKISTFEREFLSFIVTDDGRTIGERLGPALEASRGGKAPLALTMDPRRAPDADR